jgi:hypothetical protein
VQDEITKWVLWCFGILVTGGMMFWLKAMHSTLKDIHKDLKMLGKFQAATEVHMADIYRRLDKLETKES